jgi:bile acid-coenzyme A ligase
VTSGLAIARSSHTATAPLRALATVPDHFSAIRPGLHHKGEIWDWATLRRRSAQWRDWLADRDVSPDALVAFSFPNGPEFVALVFGIYAIGATPAPLSPKLPAFERDAILEVMRPALFVSEGQGPSLEDAPHSGTAPPHIAASWKACTSGGSTGRPKVIVDGRPAAFAEGADFIGIPQNGCAFVPGPLYHNACFSAAIFALWRGSTVVTMDRFDAREALSTIERTRAEWSIMVPTMLHRIMALPASVRNSFDLSRWRMVVHTAAPMPEWLKRAWIEWRGPDHIWEVYGATEGLVRCWIGGGEWLSHPGSVGLPTGGARIRILDARGVDVPIGSEGEVYAMPADGPGATYRYIGAERRQTADGWESVGDIGKLDAEGYLYLSDRRTDLIISGGVNIWPAEVEAAVLRHPAVRSCAVVGVADEDLGQRVHAVIECADGALTLETLSAFLMPFLARAKQPRSAVFQTDAVRDDAGKFRKSASPV